MNLEKLAIDKKKHIKISDLQSFINKIVTEGGGDKLVLIGDNDEFGRNDKHVTGAIRKCYGFDQSNDYFYVLVGEQAGTGCML